MAILFRNGWPNIIGARTRGRLRDKREELIAALTGLIQPHQRYMLRLQLDHVIYLDGVISDLDREIEQRTSEAEKVLERLLTIPGIGIRTAQVIVAEIGIDTSHFPSADHLASWSGLVPGQNESAGKRKPARARPGNKSLRNALVEAARAAARTKNTYLAAQHARLSRHLKGKKATVALAHSLVIIIYHVLNGAVYQDLGPDYFIERDRKELERRALRDLARLGYDVSLKLKTAA